MAQAPPVSGPVKKPFQLNAELIEAVRAQHAALIVHHQFPKKVPNFWRDIYQESPDVQRRVEDVFVLAVARRLLRLRLESGATAWPNQPGFKTKTILKRARALTANRQHPFRDDIFGDPHILAAAYQTRREYALLTARNTGRQLEWRNAAWGRCWPESAKVVDIEIHWLARFLATRESHGVFKRKGDLFVLDGDAVDTAPAFGSEHFVSWVTDHGPALAIRARTGINYRRPSSWVLPEDPFDVEELMDVAMALERWPTSRDERDHYGMWASVGALVEVFRQDPDVRQNAEIAVTNPSSNGGQNAIRLLEAEPRRARQDLCYRTVIERAHIDFKNVTTTAAGVRSFMDGLAGPLIGGNDRVLLFALAGAADQQAERLCLVKMALSQLHNVEAAHDQLARYAVSDIGATE